MNVFENQALLRAILIAASGVVVGLMLSLGRGLVRLIWKYKREAADVPLEELLPALAMAFTPITKVFYALVATMALSQRNLSESDLAILATFAGGALALVAVVQGAWAAKLINTPTAKEGLIGTFRFKLALLGSVETFAIFALVGTLVFSARLSAPSAPTASTAPASILYQRGSVGEETSFVCAERALRRQVKGVDEPCRN